jgi:hypothetical protein
MEVIKERELPASGETNKASVGAIVKTDSAGETKAAQTDAADSTVSTEDPTPKYSESELKKRIEDARREAQAEKDRSIAREKRKWEDSQAAEKQRQTEWQNQNLTPNEESDFRTFQKKLLDDLGLDETNDAVNRVLNLHRQNIILNRVGQGAYQDFRTKSETLSKQLKEATAKRFSAELDVPADIIQDAFDEAEKEIGKELTPKMQERLAKAAAAEYRDTHKANKERPSGKPDNNMPSSPGGGKPVFTRAQIGKRDFYVEHKDEIDLASREGRIK